MNNATPTFAIFAPPTTRCLFLLLTCLLKTNSFSSIKEYPLIFVVWKKKCENVCCMENSRIILRKKNNAPKFEMHLWRFFLQTIYTPLLNFSILTNYYYTTKCTNVEFVRFWQETIWFKQKRTCLKDSMNITKTFLSQFFCENLSNSSFHEISWNLDPFFGTSNVLNFLKTFGVR